MIVVNSTMLNIAFWFTLNGGVCVNGFVRSVNTFCKLFINKNTDSEFLTYENNMCQCGWFLFKFRLWFSFSASFIV